MHVCEVLHKLVAVCVVQPSNQLTQPVLPGHSPARRRCRTGANRVSQLATASIASKQTSFCSARHLLWRGGGDRRAMPCYSRGRVHQQTGSRVVHSPILGMYVNPPAAQELQAQLSLREGCHAPQVANHPQTLRQLDVGAQPLQQLLQHCLRHGLSLQHTSGSNTPSHTLSTGRLSAGLAGCLFWAATYAVADGGSLAGQ